jgi:hypothetical protein
LPCIPARRTTEVTVLDNIFDDYLREDEAKEALGKTRRTLRLWRQQRYGPPWVKIGRDVILYPKAGFRDWLKANEVGSISNGRDAA